MKFYTLSASNKAAFNKLLAAALDDYITRLSNRGAPAKAAMDMYVKALGQ